MDEGHPRVLTKLNGKIAELLAIVYELLLQMAFMPEDWQVPNITSTFKKGFRADSGNFRPWNESHFSRGKVVEFIIKNKVSSHLEKHGMLEKV